MEIIKKQFCFGNKTHPCLALLDLHMPENEGIVIILDKFFASINITLLLGLDVFKK